MAVGPHLAAGRPSAAPGGRFVGAAALRAGPGSLRAGTCTPPASPRRSSPPPLETKRAEREGPVVHGDAVQASVEKSYGTSWATAFQPSHRSRAEDHFLAGECTNNAVLCQQLRCSIQQAEGQRDTASRVQGMLRAEVNSLRAHVRSLIAEREAGAAVLGRKDAEIAGLRAQLRSGEHLQKADLWASFASARKRLHAVQAELTASESAVHRLTAAVHQEQHDAAQLREQMSRLCLAAAACLLALPAPQPQPCGH